MERKFASIQRVKTVDNILHPADGSETTLARISFENIAWQCVAKRGEFAPGDFAIYIEISTVVPEHPVFEFLRSKKFKVKTVRLCGVLSQGLALPLETLEQFLPKEHGWLTFNPGDDVSEIIGVTRHEPPVDVRINGTGRVRTFPSEVVPRTDEERVQSFPHILDHFRGMNVVATLKHDGTSATYFWDVEQDKLRVCSRNMEKLDPDESVYWQVLKTQPDIERICKENPMLVFQGEITGPAIQKNRMARKQPVFTLFNVFDRDDGSYIPQYYAKFLLDGYDVPWVETVYEWSEFDATIEELLTLAKGDYPGTKNPREGIVLRPFMEEKYVYVLGGRLSCKVINNDYLEKGGE